jgi:hypothetical protein
VVSGQYSVLSSRFGFHELFGTEDGDALERAGKVAALLFLPPLPTEATFLRKEFASEPG